MRLTVSVFVFVGVVGLLGCGGGGGSSKKGIGGVWYCGHGQRLHCDGSGTNVGSIDDRVQHTITRASDHITVVRSDGFQFTASGASTPWSIDTQDASIDGATVAVFDGSVDQDSDGEMSYHVDFYVAGQSGSCSDSLTYLCARTPFF